MENSSGMNPILNFGIYTVGPMNDNNQVISVSSSVPYETIHYREGETIFNQGETPRGLYYVQSGCVKTVVNRSAQRGRTTSDEYVTKLVSPGEFFGYKSLVNGGGQRATAKAIRPTTVWLYPKELVLASIANANPVVKMLLEQSVADIENYENTSQLHYLASVQERIAYQLVVLAEKFAVNSSEGLKLNLKLTRSEFAQLASTINESLSRHLTEFKNEGVIELNGKEIIIKDLEALKKKSGNFDV